MKRKRGNRPSQTPCKRAKTGDGAESLPDRKSSLLYYPQVSTLREYLSSKIGKSSKKRRRYVAHYGPPSAPKHGSVEEDESVSKLLDSTFIAVPAAVQDHVWSKQDPELEVFSQQRFESTQGATLSQGSLTQSEIVDFVIWLLFRRCRSTHKPAHMLCHGFLRASSVSVTGQNVSMATGIPGIHAYSYNSHVEKSRIGPWKTSPTILGSEGDRILVNMFAYCGIYLPVEAGTENIEQLSGIPLPNLTPSKPPPHPRICSQLPGKEPSSRSTKVPVAESANMTTYQSIRLVRHRMLYGKPVLSSNGNVTFGLRHIQVFSRKHDVSDRSETIHVMKYIFPRQFGSHNVFKSEVDTRETSQAFKDYTLREHEIKRAASKHKPGRPVACPPGQTPDSKSPKRSRGAAEKLVDRIRKRHVKCSYSASSRYYCSKSGSQDSRERGTIQPAEDEMFPESTASLATPHAQVSAFCRAAFVHVFPGELWGEGEVGRANRAVVSRNIDRFIHSRRYESSAVHDMLQGIKINALRWLNHPNQQPDVPISRTDFDKRREILAESIYYIFDSFSIPLISANFHVTESSVSRSQLYYFRHDVWKRMAEPAMTNSKTSMFEEMTPAQMKKLMTRRSLGTSQVRLLPKATGLRPIINLRRRVQTRVNGESVLGKSINSVLTPAFNALNYEKVSNMPCSSP